MKIRLKYLALGFMLAVIPFAGIVACLWFLGGDSRPLVRDQVLPNGQMVKIVSFHLVWGVDHDPRDRDPGRDGFQLEYVTSAPHSDQSVRDRECLQVFELIRPISELWGFKHATINALPSTTRKGGFQMYVFKRDPAGKWTFDGKPAKVFIND